MRVSTKATSTSPGTKSARACGSPALRTAGPRRGSVYAAWDDRDGAGADPGCTGLTSASNANVYFSRSTDGGATWLATPVIIHSNPPETDQFNPWMDVDPDNGDIHVIYY